MESVAYEMLADLAGRAGDADVLASARQIGSQQDAMATRLSAWFDRAVDASLRGVDPDGLDEQLDRYLADAHAIEAQSLQLLER
jgi:ferritin-like metal-binding protein YciE